MEWMKIRYVFPIHFKRFWFTDYIFNGFANNEPNVTKTTLRETELYSLMTCRISGRGIRLCICKANFKLNTIRTTAGNCCLIFNGLPGTVLRKIGKLMQRVTAPILKQRSSLY